MPLVVTMAKVWEISFPRFSLFSGKRGLEAIWFIIIAAVVALVVAVILLFMFTDKTNVLQTGLLDCESKGGKCLLVQECEDKKGSVSEAFDCVSSPGIVSSTKCCFGVKK